MGKKEIAMKKQGLRYFSSLTSKQKDRAVFFILKIRYNLLELSDGLAKSIIFADPDFKPVDLSGSVMFLHPGLNTWIPLKFRRFL